MSNPVTADYGRAGTLPSPIDVAIDVAPAWANARRRADGIVAGPGSSEEEPFRAEAQGRTGEKVKPMIELLFVACLVGEPERCEEKSLQFVGKISHTACVMGAQPQLARWVDEHPKWRIAKWTCRTAEDRKIPV